MLLSLQDKQSKIETQQQNVVGGAKAPGQNNLPLDFAVGTAYILKAILSAKESQQLKSLDEQSKKIEESFTYIDSFENLLQKSGFRQNQLTLLVKYCLILQEDVGKEIGADLKQVEIIKSKLEKMARILLRIQELLTNQINYIGVNQDSI